MRALAAALSIALLTACASSGEHTDHEMPAAGDVVQTAQDPNLPPDASGVEQRLASSPRHGEWAMIRTGPNDSIRAWVVYPERATNAPVVLVVHEIMGLSGWIRTVADQLAADGFIAIAPDLLTMKNPTLLPTGDVEPTQARTLIRELVPAEYHRQLTAIADWGMKLPAATQRYGIVGFCWGGSASFQHAISGPDVDAAVVYYGTSPDADQLANVHAPVLGLYGGADARVNATIAPADSAMKRFGKSYEYHIFEGAGHGFLRQQAGQEGANLAATRRAWPLTVQFFRQHLEG